MDYQALIAGKNYDFLRTSPHLGRHICYLTLSGSRAYGTNNPASDVDIRGFALERPEEIFGMQHFEQAEDRATDTVIYSLQKFVHLCSQCNPNVIEMLGTEPEHVLCCNAVGRLIREHRLRPSCAAYRTRWRVTATRRQRRWNTSAVPWSRWC